MLEGHKNNNKKQLCIAPYDPNFGDNELALRITDHGDTVEAMCRLADGTMRSHILIQCTNAPSRTGLSCQFLFRSNGLNVYSKRRKSDASNAYAAVNMNIGLQ